VISRIATVYHLRYLPRTGLLTPVTKPQPHTGQALRGSAMVSRAGKENHPLSTLRYLPFELNGFITTFSSRPSWALPFVVALASRRLVEWQPGTPRARA
jgi:hypothetical protein